MALAAVQSSASPHVVSRDSGFAGGSSDVTARQPALIDRSTITLASIAAPAPTIIHVSWSFPLRARRFGFLFFGMACYRCAYTVVRPSRSKVSTSYASLVAPSMPGEPIGIPGTASPAIDGFSSSTLAIRSAGTWPSNA